VNLNIQKYFKFRRGRVPIILSCPHGGFKKPSFIPEKENGLKIPDKYTYFLGRRIIQVLKERDIKIYYILNKIHRSKLDLNRPPRSSVAFNPISNEAQEIHLEYHKIILDFAQECVNNYKKCLFIDLHGFTKPYNDYPDIIFGHLFGNTLVIENKVSNPKLKEYWGFSQILDELSNEFTLDDGLGSTDFNLAYSGGYITHRFYGRSHINAFQIEVAKYIRLDLKLLKKFINCLVAGIIKSLE